MFLSVEKGTFLFQLVNFAIFLAILEMVFLRPVRKAIAERRAYIDALSRDYERYQTQASASKAHAESIRAAARREAEAELAKARALASNESAKIAEEYNAKASAEIERAQGIVRAELDAARVGRERAAAELAQLMLARTFAEPKP